MKPQKRVSMLLTLALLLTLTPLAALAGDYEEHWSADYIDEAVSRGWMLGDGEGNMRPDDSITRGEFATMLWRVLGCPAPEEDHPFEDVPKDRYYYDALSWLFAEGVVKGYGNGCFLPDDTLTREMGFAMLARAFALASTTETPLDFADADRIAQWARDAVAALVEKGYAEGGGGELLPQKALTRGEMAKLLVVIYDGENAPELPQEPSQEPRRTPASAKTPPSPVGGGAEDDPYVIRSKTELSYIGKGDENPENYKNFTLDAHYVLTVDLTLDAWEPIGDDSDDRMWFTGSFDGGGHTITFDADGQGGAVTFNDMEYAGLFGYLGIGGVVRNLTVDGALQCIHPTYTCIGGIAGMNDCGLIEQCFVKADISASGNKTNCAGGVVGQNYSNWEEATSTVQDCYSTGEVRAFGGTANCAGGIMAVNHKEFGSATLERCYATGKVSSTGGFDSNYAGGIVGQNVGLLQECVALNVEVSATGGWNDRAGRVIGDNEATASENLAWEDMRLTGGTVSSDAGGKHGQNLTTEAAKRQATYDTSLGGLRWDFATVWSMDDGSYGLPVLKALTATPESDGSSAFLPIEVKNAKALQAIGDDLTKHYRLTTDLTLDEWTPIGDDGNHFTGSFDGGGHRITFDAGGGDPVRFDQTCAGLFGFIGTGALVKHVTVSGALESTSTGEAASSFLGGIVGVNLDGTIAYCTVTAELSSSGGSANEDYSIIMGGIAGMSIDGMIQNCYTTGGIAATSLGMNQSSYAGGIVGFVSNQNSGTLLERGVENCYAIGRISVSGGVENYVGGIVGLNFYGKVRSCMALNAEVSANGDTKDVSGRIIGFDNNGTKENNLAWEGMSLTGEPSFSDIADIHGLDLTAENAKLQSTYDTSLGGLGWDFTIWQMEGGSYGLPIFHWQTLGSDWPLLDYLTI